MKKLLLYGDSPLATTGLGKLHRILLDCIYKTGEYEIDVVALNHTLPWYDQKEVPYRIFPTLMTNDQRYGSDFMFGLIKTIDYDVIILSHDLQNCHIFYDAIFEKKKEKDVKVIGYYPVDSIETNEISAKLINAVDLPLVYSQYAKRKITEAMGKNKVKNLWLPLDLSTIFKIEDESINLETRKKLFDWDEKNFVISNINRHTARKDLAKTIWAVKEVHKQYDKVRLYLNAIENDHAGNILKLLEGLNIPLELVKISPFKNAAQSFPEEELNKIYNASDLVISTSKGEGYGYSTVEALACKKPFIGPRNTSFIELVGESEERGYLAECSGWDIDYNLGVNRRDLVDIDSMVEKIIHVIKNYDEAKEKAQKGYEFVKENIAKEVFEDKFMKLFNELTK